MDGSAHDKAATARRMAHVPPRDRDIARYDGAWPAIDRQLIILFTSRVGSSFLCRHIEKTRAASRIGEAFNRPTLEAAQRRTGATSFGAALAADVAQGAEQGWFVAKAGFPGLSIAERLGYIEHTVGRTDFWFLLRRDLIGQAISARIGQITGRFHSTQAQRNAVSDADYDAASLVDRARAVVKNCEGLWEYARAAERPIDVLFYEDFAEGDFTRPEALLDALGVPRREVPPTRSRPDLERLRYDETATWKTRLRDVPQMARVQARYDRLLRRLAEQSIG